MRDGAGRGALSHRFRPYFALQGGPNAGGAALSAVGLRIATSSNSKEGTTYVAVSRAKMPRKPPGISLTIASIPPSKPPAVDNVAAVRDRECSLPQLRVAETAVRCDEEVRHACPVASAAPGAAGDPCYRDSGCQEGPEHTVVHEFGLAGPDAVVIDQRTANRLSLIDPEGWILDDTE